MATVAGVVIGLSVPVLGAAPRYSEQGSAAPLHFTPNHNFDWAANYLPGKIGFNLADVSSPTQLATLPPNVKGLVWVGRCRGTDAEFLKITRQYIGRPHLWGFYLMDDPDPRPSGNCRTEDLKTEADWIHKNIPGAYTFIVLMNLGSSRSPSFAGSYNQLNSHIDLFGFSPYPCRSSSARCDFTMIHRYIAAAEASGIGRDQIIPVYQAFGGGEWFDDEGGRYRLPVVAEEEEIIAQWKTAIPTPLFDYVYSWGSQRGDVGLEGALALHPAFARHNREN
jgi:hypothetical protein